MAKYSYLVISGPVSGEEHAYNQWYTGQHLPDVLAVPGFIGARRFRVVGDSRLSGSYVAIYELDTDDPAAALAEVEARAGSPAMPISPALDLGTLTEVLLEPIAGSQPKST